MEQAYSKEFVNELLAWSRERLEKKDYPKGTIRIGPGRTVPDCGFYIYCLIQTLQKQGENPTFSPVVRDYNNFRKLLDGLREGRSNPYE